MSARILVPTQNASVMQNVRERAQRMVQNYFDPYSRHGLFNRYTATLLDPVGRNLNFECGYPESPTIDHYQLLYDRMSIAHRVVSVFPDECWAVYPALYETEAKRNTLFEQTFDRLNKKHHFWSELHIADKQSRIGHHGSLLIGLNDGQSLDQPFPGILEDGTADPNYNPSRSPEIIYLRSFSEKLSKVVAYQGDWTNPRYGQPLIYQMSFADPNQIEAGAAIGVQSQITLQSQRVHWTRVLHLCDNRESSKVAGMPAMRPVLNHLYDLRKTYGGSAEMFWKGAFPGYAFETYPDMTETAQLDVESIEKQIEEFQNGLKRWLATVGGKFTSLSPQVADPERHIRTYLEAICATIGVPMRVFLGTESGHLASSQDASTWNRRLMHRQKLYLEPMVIQAFVERLQLYKVLPPSKDIIVDWTDLNTMTDEAKANVSVKITQAILQYVTSGAETIMSVQTFFTSVLGYDKDEAASFIEEAKAVAGVFMTKELWDPMVAAEAAATAKGDLADQTGMSGQRNSQAR